MAKITIPISGIISQYEFEGESNVTPDTLRASLNAANGEDILITINSPGGSVFQGLEMFSMIKNYPGNVETRIVSLAASMGSILALAGKEKSAENTALYFVHNAQGVGVGDYRELESRAKFLKDVTVLLANLYAKYTNLSLKEARSFMDEDSQFFGKDLELLGFKIVESENETTEEEARVNAEIKFEEVKNKLAKEEIENDMSKIAAVIDIENYGIKPAMQEKNIKTEDSKMPKNLKEILEENPAIKNEYDAELEAKFQAGIEDGKTKIKATIEKVANFLNNENYPSQIKAVAIEVLKGEKSIETLDTMVATADMMIEMQKSNDAKDESDNAGEIKRDESVPVSQDGNCETEEDFQAVIRAEKKKLGLEVE